VRGKSFSGIAKERKGIKRHRLDVLDGQKNNYFSQFRKNQNWREETLKVEEKFLFLRYILSVF